MEKYKIISNCTTHQLFTWFIQQTRSKKPDPKYLHDQNIYVKKELWLCLEMYALHIRKFDQNIYNLLLLYININASILYFCSLL